MLWKKKAAKTWLAMAWPLDEEVKKVKVGKSKREARRLGTEKGWSGSVCQLLDITLPFFGLQKTCPRNFEGDRRSKLQDTIATPTLFDCSSHALCQFCPG